MKLSALSPRTLIITSLVAGMSIGAMGVTAAIARQPNMEDAIDHLIRADRSLQRATDNKGGHKARARQLIADAIFQVRQGMRAAN